MYLKQQENAALILKPTPNQKLVQKWSWSCIKNLSNQIFSPAQQHWFNCLMPKCFFIAWMHFHGPLATKDRLFNFGLIQEQVFCFCGFSMESRYHLFFEYEFSAQVLHVF
ncbi:hypothetical protein L6164_006035 [Bauhinia variegata]|uniref:Uncharacterized protein n=1 Tax=Bauhinia variegata TaxID=167791 RepID=A0ACB9PT61_BAUVA|nr:hypothetical protein L6164_006035 [Bauhinia variegata]